MVRTNEIGKSFKQWKTKPEKEKEKQRKRKKNEMIERNLRIYGEYENVSFLIYFPFFTVKEKKFS
jgi:hypothetical protein